MGNICGQANGNVVAPLDARLSSSVSIRKETKQPLGTISKAKDENKVEDVSNSFTKSRVHGQYSGKNKPKVIATSLPQEQVKSSRKEFSPIMTWINDKKPKEKDLEPLKNFIAVDFVTEPFEEITVKHIDEDDDDKCFQPGVEKAEYGGVQWSDLPDNFLEVMQRLFPAAEQISAPAYCLRIALQQEKDK